MYMYLASEGKILTKMLYLLFEGCRGVLSLMFTKFNSIPKDPDPAYSDRIQDALKVSDSMKFHIVCITVGLIRPAGKYVQSCTCIY